jgi:D-beta-D-heptose 7-phosphate kinase/D-beta-D-heptose 1-phosphate adenosyltransferase
MDIQEKIKIFFNRFKKSNLKIAVFGDSIVDEYFYVDSTRISPEFPIPVNLTGNDKPNLTLPGGAGNVCRQFFNFNNIELNYFSLLDDESKKCYEKNNIKTDNCLVIPGPNCKIPRKKRFYNNQVPLFRWDVEKENFGMSNVDLYQRELFKLFEDCDSDICIFSDYSKGVFNNDLNYGFFKSVVDAKKHPLGKWSGCDVFKPNSVEALSLTSTENHKDQCSILKSKIKCNSVLVTDSYKGFYGIDQKNEFFEYQSKKEKQAACVIGGGDCYVAYLTIALQLGFDLYDSAEIAFNISYFYVTKNNNKNLRPVDFYKFFNSKFIDTEDLCERNFKLIFTNGCFDAGLTPGHIECLRFAKNQGGKVIVALNSDDSIKRLKGKNRPILNLEDRMEIISSIEFVDFVLSFEEDTPEKLINQIKPDSIVKGGDYLPEEVVGKETAEVLICPYKKSISTTDKLEMING